jgi:ABC-type phosphate/phosphonate transport system substrate-binding protein
MMIEFIVNHKEWLVSGIGVPAALTVARWVRRIALARPVSTGWRTAGVSILLTLVSSLSYAATDSPSDAPLILTAPPRESDAKAHEIYDPIARFISQAINRPVVFHATTTWGAYQSLMQRDKFDLDFDGPHFVAWRIQHLKHQPLMKIDEPFEFVVIVRKDGTAHSLKDVQGRMVCSSAPPNLGALVLLSQFEPSRIPAIYPVDGWGPIFKGLVAKKCEAAVLPKSQMLAFDPNGHETRIIYEHPKMPNDSLSASTRVTDDEMRKITAALLSPAAAEPLAAYRAKYMLHSHLVPATKAEYLSLSDLLDGYVGF